MQNKHCSGKKEGSGDHQGSGIAGERFKKYTKCKKHKNKERASYNLIFPGKYQDNN